MIKENLDSMYDGEVFQSLVLIKSYSVKPTKTGGRYLFGCLEMKGSVDFKVWQGELLDTMVDYDYSDTICQVSGKINEYNGIKSVILTDVKAVDDPTISKSDFFADKYNSDAYLKALIDLVLKNCSPEAVGIYNMIMSNSDICQKFKTEFAARSHHDAVKSGLLAHTYKVTFIMSRVIKLYGNIMSGKFLDVDCLILGSVLHDIGKIFEYTNGAIINNGLLVSHHTFGVEILCSYKDDIVRIKGEEFYYRLLAVIEQHHGDFGETPRTVEAAIIHMVDNLESKLQAIDESYDSGITSLSLGDWKLN